MNFIEHFDNENWKAVFEILKHNPKLVQKINPYDLAWKIFQYSIAENGKEKLVEPFGEFEELKKVVEFCKTKKLKPNNLPQAVAFDDKISIAELLRDKSNLGSEDFGERTALFVAAAKNDLETIQLLVESGCNISHYDVDNFEAIDYTNSEKIISYLESVGGKTISQRKKEYEEYCEAKDFWNKLNDK